MSLKVEFFDETSKISEKQLKLVNDLLSYAAETEDVENSELSLTFVDTERITEINREYRGKDYATDVISFALDDGEEEPVVVGEGFPHLLGEIVVCVEKISEQADEYRHSFDRELGFLTVHGFLHLLGYDHMNEEEEKEMFDKQKRILEQYGLTR